MSAKSFAACALCLVLGVGAGTALPSRSAGPGTPPPADHARPLRITEAFDPDAAPPRTPESVEVVPYRIVENGRVRNIEDAKRLPRHWIVVIDGGRIQVFGTSER